MVYIHLLLLVIGFVLLIKGSDFFVEASSRIAKRFGVSEFIIGLTLVAIGTSIPELASSIVASLKGESGLIIGNIVGSNIANIGLVLGIGALFATIKIKHTMLKRDAYMMIFVSVLFYVLAFDLKITIIEGLFFLLLFITYTLFLITSKKTREVYDFGSFLNYFLKFQYLRTIRDRPISKKKKKKESTLEEKKKYYAFKEGLLKDSLIIILSAIAIVFGARYLINEAIWLAELLQVSTTLIGITLVAVGTSLPELTVSIRAAKKGFGDMIIGNIIGSNISNILLILGISSLINTITIEKSIIFYSAPIMLAISVLLVILMRSRWKIEKREGIILIIAYVAYIASLIFMLP